MIQTINKRNPVLLECVIDPVQAVLHTDISMIIQGTPMREDGALI